MSTGEPCQIEYRFNVPPTVATGWHPGRARPHRDTTGQIVKWFGTCTDIDDHKRAEHTLRLLDEIATALATSMDTAAIVERTNRIVVPAFADWSAVVLSDEKERSALPDGRRAMPAYETAYGGHRSAPGDPSSTTEIRENAPSEPDLSPLMTVPLAVAEGGSAEGDGLRAVTEEARRYGVDDLPSRRGNPGDASPWRSTTRASIKRRRDARRRRRSKSEVAFVTSSCQALALITIQSGPEHIYEVSQFRRRSALHEGRQVLGKSLREAFPDADGGLIKILDGVYRSGERFLSVDLPTWSSIGSTTEGPTRSSSVSCTSPTTTSTG